MHDIRELERLASQARRDVLRMVHSAKSGHPGGALGCAFFFTVLFNHFFRINPQHFTMDGIGEDIFILSNGHISPIFYSTLSRKGYFDIQELSTFRKINSRLQGHPATEEGLQGIRIATGSLGQGLSVAIGAALSKRLNKDYHLVFSLHGDGELQEDQNWEAFMFGAHHKIDNLIVTIDYNNAQIDERTEDVISLGNLKSKIESFGWQVFDMNGNDINQIIGTMGEAIAFSGKGTPIAIIMATKMGFGVDFMEDDYQWHGVAPDDDQLNRALYQLEETLGDY